MINYFVVEVSGKRPKQFLTTLFKMEIEVIDVKYYKNKVSFKVSYFDYNRIKSIKTIYEIKIIDIKGMKRFNILLNQYKVFLIFFVIGIALIFFVSRFIFFIDIDTNNKQMRQLLNKELNKHNITLYSYNKSYDELEKIKKIIRDDNKDKIEWIEFEQVGVLFRVKVIERISALNKKYDSSYKDIVASKNGYIRDIYVSSGEIVKNKDDYVKKGDIIVSGNIHRNENVVSKVKASGVVYGEVWYKIDSSMPLIYSDYVKGNRGSLKLQIRIFNNNFTLFKINKRIKEEKIKYLFDNNLFSIVCIFEKNKFIKKFKYDENKASSMLIKQSINKMKSTLGDGEYIISQKVLKKYKKNGKMFVEVFVKTYENISKEALLKEEIIEKED